MNAIKKQVSARVLDEITQQIEDGVWQAGQKLPSLTLFAKKLSVGVSTVREALRVLEHRGYVLIEHGRGVFVRNQGHWSSEPSMELMDPGEGDLFSLLEFRSLLEPEMAALAADRGSPGQIRKIKQSASSMLKNLADGDDYFPADLAFHEYIADACANPVMAKVMKGISDLLLESRRKLARIRGSAERASHFHMLIALAIEQRNQNQARDMMKAHIEDIRQDYIQLQQMTTEEEE